MLEMTEAAAIVHGATEHSLVLMDEIGRGTSTFDGLALAGAIATQLHDRNRAFTLFATHYFELTEFPTRHERAVNLHVGAVESGHDIVFLHQIEPGPASRSYGVQVARLAGMPAALIRQARATLEALEPRPRPARRRSTCSRRRPRPPRPSRRRWRPRWRDRPRRADPARGARRAVPSEIPAQGKPAMTYCVGIRLNAGLVFLSDSRTNAGMDQISTFRKMMIYEKPGDRFMVMLSAGNLSISQSVREILQVEKLDNGDERAADDLERRQHVRRGAGAGQRGAPRLQQDGPSLKAAGIDFNASMIFGGQIKGEAMRMFLVYSAGNFIEATRETCFFQVGESKYGKPILDRVLTPTTPLDEAAKCALVSMDSTLKSNLSVGLPLDLLVYREGQLRSETDTSASTTRTRTSSMIHSTWGQRLREVFEGIDDPRWDGGDTTAPADDAAESSRTQRFEPMRKITGHPGERHRLSVATSACWRHASARTWPPVSC
jgi:putative proteasome-type protease